ncbi:GNAT family N-acetyltransferase [Aestuariivita sp.]|jgi:RimJ/RimL family protein N-acetyltransferase|uniref:GNAT family N-acetyltransferase n=1 Tax=Aestuariivita sp. TaxID=1872407 RepID=UPI00216CFAAA|nr:GNAT family N-acetyltransferase [Aestuariivita sp.]MCE8005719.1 GNAT family N-acetyltransferase [Aestuariivita sp.]
MRQTLTTQRLTLRPFVMDDADDLVRLIGNLNVSKWLTIVPHPYTMADAGFFITSLASQGATYAVCRDGALIGCVAIADQLGYWYAEPHWGQGFATEAASAVVAEYFMGPSQDLTSGYHLGNAGSRHVLEKLGFVPTDLRNAYSKAQHREVLLQDMVLTRTRWEGLQ